VLQPDTFFPFLPILLKNEGFLEIDKMEGLWKKPNKQPFMTSKQAQSRKTVGIIVS
jgi:hypothetical protein